LNIFLEITLIGCIIYLSFTIYRLKKNQFNVESIEKENNLLKDQLTNREQEHTRREKSLNQTINDLRSSFDKEQSFLEERRVELDSKEKNLLESIANLESQLIEETESKKKIVSQKKSSEVRLGGIAETLAPFLDQFEFDPENCTFLGKPIDYISFGKDAITLIEVKSGNSQLNKKQRQIRDQVKDNLVEWKEIRIK
jgi:predicted Holliday junction resolvase-like endonuclease